MPRLLLSAVLLAATAGCGDNLRDTADLAGADPAHLRRAVDAASAADATTAYRLAVDLAATGDATSCPRVEREGDVTVITGGCDGADGPIVGRIVVEQSLIGARDAAMARATFEGFGSPTWVVDGVVEQAPDGATVVADLHLTAGGIAVASSLALDCDANGLCAAGEGAWIDIDDLGIADVRGAWRAEPAGGYLTLAGDQIVTFDLNAIEDGCVPYTVDGAPGGALCP